MQHSEQPAGSDIRLIACPHPFAVERIDRTVPAGQTVAELLEEVVDPALLKLAHSHVFVGDQMVPAAFYSRVKPRAGQTVTIRTVPGDSGGGDGKNVTRTLLTIAVIAAAIYVGGLELGALKVLGSTISYSSLAAGGIPICGCLAVNLTAAERFQ